jgi:hypothetical protein
LSFPTRSYFTKNLASSPFSASLNHVLIVRYGWPASTNDPCLIVLSNDSL